MRWLKEVWRIGNLTREGIQRECKLWLFVFGAALQIANIRHMFPTTALRNVFGLINPGKENFQMQIVMKVYKPTPTSFSQITDPTGVGTQSLCYCGRETLIFNTTWKYPFKN